MFRALISPSSGVSQAVFYIQPFGSCGVYIAHLRVPVDWFVVVVSLYWCRGGSPVLVALRVPVSTGARRATSELIMPANSRWNLIRALKG